ncbi:aldehyde ferredoxin oxidoreductase N-terminal domain-containing protein, partial [Nitrospinota bacterium]
MGGFFGHELKRAGFDAVIIKGRAESPVYIWIHEGQVEIKRASHLWGKTVEVAQDAI